jgi:hypothetical protein
LLLALLVVRTPAGPLLYYTRIVPQCGTTVNVFSSTIPYVDIILQ